MTVKGQGTFSGNQYGNPPESAAEILSQQYQVSWDMQDLNPTGGEYVALEDQLVLTFISSIGGGGSIVVGVTLLRPDGEVLVFQQGFTLNNSRTAQRNTINLAEGFLLGVTVGVPTTVSDSLAVYAMLELQRGGASASNAYRTLCAGYVTAVNKVFWPYGTNQKSTDGAGALRSITGSIPAAGADVNEVAPATVRWQLRAIRATLTTSSTAATRQVTLTLDDGTNVYAKFPASTTQLLSLADEYDWANYGGQNLAPLTGLVTITIPEGIEIPPSGHIRTSTASIQVGDQWSAPQYLVREWYSGI
jgi:hypothetical protein